MKLISVMVFIVMQSLIKAAHVPAGEAVFFRSTFAIPVIVVWLAMQGQLTTGFATKNPMGHVWRGLMGTIAMGLGFGSFNGCFSLGFCLGFVGRAHRDVVEGHVVAGCELIKLAVVAHNGANVNGQQATLPTEEQIVQAVTFFADQNDSWHGLLGVVQIPSHLEGDGKADPLAAQFSLAHCGASKLHAHEKQAGVRVVVLGGLFDVAATRQ
jgi:hypothetical protein